MSEQEDDQSAVQAPPDAPADAPEHALPPAAPPPETYHLTLDASGVVIGKIKSNCPQAGSVEVSQDLYEAAKLGGSVLKDGELSDYVAPPQPAPKFYMTGKDVIDGMSRAQANDPAVDQRDVVRIAAAPRASEVKGCISRIEKDLKLSAGTLLGQSTASGGT